MHVRLPESQLQKLHVTDLPAGEHRHKPSSSETTTTKKGDSQLHMLLLALQEHTMSYVMAIGWRCWWWWLGGGGGGGSSGGDAVGASVGDWCYRAVL